MLKINVLKAVSIFLVLTAASVSAADPVHGGNLKNPYDSDLLSVNQIISTYHNHVNETFNNTIRLMLEAQEASAKKPGAADDPNGKPLKSAVECLDPSNNRNYSTFCLSVVLLGGNSDECLVPVSVGTGLKPLTEDFKKFCELGGGARPLKGYLNFKAALERKKKNIFETEKDRDKWQQLGKNTLDSATAIGKIFSRNTNIDEEIKIAKKALDQTLSAYDQLRLAWPMHVRYKQIYKDLQDYRDKIVDIRHQVDLYPSKFIDLTTTKCL